MTTVKSRVPLKEVSQQDAVISDDMTVEQFLQLKCDEIIKDFQKNTAMLVSKLRQEYNDGANSIKELMSETALTSSNKLCVTLKVIAGAHIGQKFRLEPTSEDGDDAFKIGRSTGKMFKEKGVSLYKDKEISTTHAKVEIRNGQAFFVDLRSTNGSQLNNQDVEAQVPLRLCEGDVITVGTSELMVHISDLSDDSSDNDNKENDNTPEDQLV